MAAPLEQKVGFPVAQLDTASIATLAVERLPQDRGDRFAIAPGLGDVQNILMEARADDPPDRRLDVVWVRVDDAQFDGTSYGLALALADQRVRAGPCDFAPLIATGVMARAGRGRIAPVEAFGAKAIAVVAHARAGRACVDFAFPAENLRRADAATRETLDYAVAEGVIRIHPAETLADLRSLWRDTSADAPVARHYRALALAGGLVAALLIAGAMALHGGGPRTAITSATACSDAVGALGPGTRPEQAGDAVRACERAVSDAPGNGRLHFLLGQAFALNGSDTLAGDAWKAGAERDDADSMAAYGRWLWLSNPADVSRVTTALGWLRRGAAAGSAAAAEDVGYVLVDGNALPVDQAQAQRWFNTAREMRARKD